MHLVMLGNQDHSRGSLRRSREPRGRAPSLPEKLSAGFPEQYLDQTLGGDEDSAPAQSFSAGPAALEPRELCAAGAVCFLIRFTATNALSCTAVCPEPELPTIGTVCAGESIVSRKSLQGKCFMRKRRHEQGGELALYCWRREQKVWQGLPCSDE